MAEIAAIFHWPLSELAAMPLETLLHWHGKAVATHNHIHRAGRD